MELQPENNIYFRIFFIYSIIEGYTLTYSKPRTSTKVPGIVDLTLFSFNQGDMFSICLRYIHLIPMIIVQ